MFYIFTKFQPNYQVHSWILISPKRYFKGTKLFSDILFLFKAENRPESFPNRRENLPKVGDTRRMEITFLFYLGRARFRHFIYFLKKNKIIPPLNTSFLPISCPLSIYWLFYLIFSLIIICKVIHFLFIFFLFPFSLTL